MADESSNQQFCTGRRQAVVAYGVVQISATFVSALSLAAIAIGLCAEAGKQTISWLCRGRCG